MYSLIYQFAHSFVYQYFVLLNAHPIQDANLEAYWMDHTKEPQQNLGITIVRGIVTSPMTSAPEVF